MHRLESLCHETRMDNRAIANIFYETADLMEVANEDPFRIRSYRRAAEAIEGQPNQIASIIHDDKAVLAIPGIGPIIAAGPIVATLSGAGVGAVAGGLIGGLTDIGVSRTDAEYYAESVRRGGALVTVRADDSRADRAADIMREHGAIDIERRAEQWRDRGWSGFDEKAAPYTPADLDRDRDLYGATDRTTGIAGGDRPASGSIGDTGTAGSAADRGTPRTPGTRTY